MNNTILDIHNLIKIPQNTKRNFSIQKYDKWEYSIKIDFKYNELINLLNLFLIVKSFVLDSHYAPYAICTSFKVDDKREAISEKNDLKWIKNVDYYAFEEWIQYRIEKDSKYERTDYFNGIIILYPKGLYEIKKIENENFLDYLKPIYPWPPSWLEKFKNQIDTIKLLEEKIKFYENLFKKK